MRYRKRITIGKGVRVNISKSGVSLTAGVPGVSINTGKNGAYLNTGIPGTGIYDRTRIGGSNTKSTHNAVAEPNRWQTPSGQYFPQSANKYNLQGEIRISFEDDGTYSFYDGNDVPITDRATINFIKNSETFIRERDRLARETEERYNAITKEYVDIYKQSCRVYPKSFYYSKLRSLKPETYIPQTYSVPKPTRGAVYEKLIQEAESNVSTMKFWRKQALKEEYVAARLEPTFNAYVSNWEADKRRFDQSELNKKTTLDTQYLQAYTNAVEYIRKLFANDISAIDYAIQDWFTDVSFPFEFHVDYQVINDTLLLDIDLPEIEDMPKLYASQLASGGIKIKEKPKKQLKEEYYNCVL